jgi:anion-transporting  ArsA/GET3 family ATPase
MNEGLRALTGRRLLIVTGKGGTGKSTLAAALGLLVARQGIDTVVVEVGDPPDLPRLFGSDPGQLEGEGGRIPVAVAPNLYTLRIVPEVALTEYLEIQLRVRTLVRLIVGNAGFRHLLDAAPGWRALITLGKLWHLQTQVWTRDDGPRWPLLIMDAPSTGHGLSFLSVPKVVLDTVRLGPLRKHTEGVQDLLKDPSRTLVLPVTLPEELPVTETLDICSHVRELGLALGPLTANAVESAPEIPDLDAVLHEIARNSRETEAPQVLAPDVIRICVEHRRRRAALQQGFLEKLRKESGAALLTLPYLSNGIEDTKGLAALAEELERQLETWEPLT